MARIVKQAFRRVKGGYATPWGCEVCAELTVDHMIADFLIYIIIYKYIFNVFYFVPNSSMLELSILDGMV